MSVIGEILCCGHSVLAEIAAELKRGIYAKFSKYF